MGLSFTHTNNQIIMESTTKTTKTLKVILKALDFGRYILLVTFAFLFGVTGLGILLASEFNIFNLFGFAGCALVAWTCWSIRRD